MSNSIPPAPLYNSLSLKFLVEQCRLAGVVRIDLNLNPSDAPGKVCATLWLDKVSGIYSFDEDGLVAIQRSLNALDTQTIAHGYLTIGDKITLTDEWRRSCNGGPFGTNQIVYVDVLNWGGAGQCRLIDDNGQWVTERASIVYQMKLRGEA